MKTLTLTILLGLCGCGLFSCNPTFAGSVNDSPDNLIQRYHRQLDKQATGGGVSEEGVRYAKAEAAWLDANAAHIKDLIIWLHIQPPDQVQADTRLTKAEWYERATAVHPNIKNHVISSMRATDLYTAVGKPDKTMSFGRDTLLYWFCQDGTIRARCVTMVYINGWIIGTDVPSIDDY